MIGGLLFVTVDTTQAAELPTPYDFRDDPFLIEWSFALEKEKIKEQAEVAKILSAEEKVLNRWKEKQASKWHTLPEGQFTINASAYTAAPDETGGKGDGITASGLKVVVNRTIACPPEYPFGALITIEGMGTYRCEDRGGAIKGNKFDIYMETKKEAFAFGRQHLTAEVIPQ